MMKKIYTLAIVLLVLGVSSCKLGKHYSRPELRLPEQIEGTVPDSVSAGDIRWTDLYTDPVLRQLIRKTLEGNKDLMIAAAKVKESMELRRIAKADLFPKAEATVSAEREYDETPGNTFEGKVLASWEVDLWGKLRWAGQAALAEYLQSVEGRQALQSALVAQVAQAYFELIALDQELAIVRQTLAARQEGVRLAKLRFEGGLTSENPLRQAQVELARTQTLVPGLERESDYFTGRRISRRSGEREKYRSAAVDDRSAGGIIFPNPGKTARHPPGRISVESGSCQSRCGLYQHVPEIYFNRTL